MRVFYTRQEVLAFVVGFNVQYYYFCFLFAHKTLANKQPIENKVITKYNLDELCPVEEKLHPRRIKLNTYNMMRWLFNLSGYLFDN